MVDLADALDLLLAQNPDRVQDSRSKSSLVVSARRVGFQAMCLRNVEFQWNGLVCRRVRFGYTDFRSADTDTTAVFGAAAVADVAVAAAAIGVVAVVAGLFPDDPRDNHLDRIALTFFVVFYQKTIQNDLKSSALSE